MNLDWHEYFYYDETSPTCLRWKVSVGNTKEHSQAGWVGADGYWCVQCNKRTYLVHRIIWTILFGEIQGIVKIDHINNNRLDNVIVNLRLASDADNARHQIMPKNNTSGYKGVSKRKHRYTAKITYMYKQIHLGYFNTAEDAARAYDARAIELFGEYALTNKSLGLLQ